MARRKLLADTKAAEKSGRALTFKDQWGEQQSLGQSSSPLALEWGSDSLTVTSEDSQVTTGTSIGGSNTSQVSNNNNNNTNTKGQVQGLGQGQGHFPPMHLSSSLDSPTPMGLRTPDYDSSLELLPLPSVTSPGPESDLGFGSGSMLEIGSGLGSELGPVDSLILIPRVLRPKVSFHDEINNATIPATTTTTEAATTSSASASATVTAISELSTPSSSSLFTSNGDVVPVNPPGEQKVVPTTTANDAMMTTPGTSSSSSSSVGSGSGDGASVEGSAGQADNNGQTTNTPVIKSILKKTSVLTMTAGVGEVASGSGLLSGFGSGSLEAKGGKSPSSRAGSSNVSVTSIGNMSTASGPSDDPSKNDSTKSKKKKGVVWSLPGEESNVQGEGDDASGTVVSAGVEPIQVEGEEAKVDEIPPPTTAATAAPSSTTTTSLSTPTPTSNVPATPTQASALKEGCENQGQVFVDFMGSDPTGGGGLSLGEGSLDSIDSSGGEGSSSTSGGGGGGIGGGIGGGGVDIADGPTSEAIAVRRALAAAGEYILSPRHTPMYQYILIHLPTHTNIHPNTPSAIFSTPPAPPPPSHIL